MKYCWDYYHNIHFFITFYWMLRISIGFFAMHSYWKYLSFCVFILLLAHITLWLCRQQDAMLRYITYFFKILWHFISFYLRTFIKTLKTLEHFCCLLYACMSRAIGVFFFCLFSLFLLICYFTVTSTTTTMNGHPLKTPTPLAPTATTLTTTPTWEKWQGQREVMTGAGARDATVSSPWYIFFLLFYDYTNYYT